MAKKQELVLNTNKLSGACGRLMCCLGFEYSEKCHEEFSQSEVETISVAEDVEGSEVMIASIDLLPEDIAPAPQIAATALDSNPGPIQAERQAVNAGRRERRRKWHPKRRRKKTQDN